MTHDAYMARIANATPLQLVIILHELAIDFIDEAAGAGLDSDELKAALRKGRGAVSELFESLDMDVPTSEELAANLLHVNKLLIHAGVARGADAKAAHLAEARHILAELLDAWKQLEADDTLADKIFDNPPQIFAGLTYSKDGKLTEFLDDDPNRGYKA